jgi:hypothetical protein
VRAVDEPGRNLAGPVPAAQGSAGDAGVGDRSFERDPVGTLEPGVQLEFEFPFVEAIFPVPDISLSLPTLLIAWY